jgi:hypothetical protein
VTAAGLFAKVPRPGRVKTRLVPPLTFDEAAAVARACLEESLRRFPAAVAAPWTLFLDEAPEPWLTELAAGNGVAIEFQGDGDLGERLARAFRRLGAEGGRAVVIGSDSPTLDPGRIRAAFERLDASDLVLGPARDGGCYLIGVHREPGALLEGIPWGTARVLGGIARNAAAMEWRVDLLPEWYDLDEAADLERAAPDLGDCPALASMLEEVRARIEGAARARG